MKLDPEPPVRQSPHGVPPQFSGSPADSPSSRHRLRFSGVPSRMRAQSHSPSKPSRSGQSSASPLPPATPRMRVRPVSLAVPPSFADRSRRNTNASQRRVPLSVSVPSDASAKAVAAAEVEAAFQASVQAMSPTKATSSVRVMQLYGADVPQHLQPVDGQTSERLVERDVDPQSIHDDTSHRSRTSYQTGISVRPVSSDSAGYTASEHEDTEDVNNSNGNSNHIDDVFSPQISAFPSLVDPEMDEVQVDRYGFIMQRSTPSTPLRKRSLFLQRASNSLFSSRGSPSARPPLSAGLSTTSLSQRPFGSTRSVHDTDKPPPAQPAGVTKSSLADRNRYPAYLHHHRIDLRTVLLGMRRREILDPDDTGDQPGPERECRRFHKEVEREFRRVRKEIKREGKWLKMGGASPAGRRARGQDTVGGGTVFSFDTLDPKLISRTWKGIPDKCRASAWYGFLDASVSRWWRQLARSAGHSDSSLPDSELHRFDSPVMPLDHSALVSLFHALQRVPCADDVQIDIDIPRTISPHVLFRHRYRGGQRCLFRLLHALALHTPETGYVQGIASLGATLLCYFDEDAAFVMLVRMWRLRGLEWLYRADFGNLTASLNDLNEQWLGQSPAGKKLAELGIPPANYGIRWYLTLFNHSLAFPTQLRIWDVIMLLGDYDVAKHAGLAVDLTQYEIGMRRTMQREAVSRYEARCHFTDGSAPDPIPEADEQDNDEEPPCPPEPRTTPEPVVRAPHDSVVSEHPQKPDVEDLPADQSFVSPPPPPPSARPWSSSGRASGPTSSPISSPPRNRLKRDSRLQHPSPRNGRLAHSKSVSRSVSGSGPSPVSTPGRAATTGPVEPQPAHHSHRPSWALASAFLKKSIGKSEQESLTPGSAPTPVPSSALATPSAPLLQYTIAPLHAVASAIVTKALHRPLVTDQADFETAMQALTSQFPVQDDDLLMTTARDQWRHVVDQQRRRRR